MNPEQYTSNWEYTKSRSRYHFDPTIMDPRWDTVQGIGRFDCDLAPTVARAIEQARPVNWETRSGSATPSDWKIPRAGSTYSSLAKC